MATNPRAVATPTGHTNRAVFFGMAPDSPPEAPVPNDDGVASGSPAMEALEARLEADTARVRAQACLCLCLLHALSCHWKPQDVDGRLAIHYAAMNGHTMSVLALAAYGADINSCTKNGRTAMHGACWNGHTQTALQLVEMGADSEARSNDGATPLIDAARNGHTDAVISLVISDSSDKALRGGAYPLVASDSSEKPN